jgi:hypothetical protein
MRPALASGLLCRAGCGSGIGPSDTALVDDIAATARRGQAANRLGLSPATSSPHLGFRFVIEPAP